jgi:transposase
VKALVTKLVRQGRKLRFCYEAGTCGYGIRRQLTAAEHDCIVVAPSLIPERIKTDRRSPHPARDCWYTNSSTSKV